MCNYPTMSPITVFINFVFLHLYILFFIPLYAKIMCLQHSVTYHGGVIVGLNFYRAACNADTV